VIQTKEVVDAYKAAHPTSVAEVPKEEPK